MRLAELDSCSFKFSTTLYSYIFLAIFMINLTTAAVQNHSQHQHRRRQIPGTNDFDEYSLSNIQVISPSNNECYSCASSAYLYFWNQLLMHHYFPPKNFTDRCWQPDIDIGSVPCMSACFTIVEEVYAHDPLSVSGQAVMRGCVDRLLLFGMDVDVKEAIISYDEMCRAMDRHLLQLVPLNQDNPVVMMCTCVGKLCNKNDAENILSIATKTYSNFSLFSLLFFAAIINLILLLNAFR